MNGILETMTLTECPTGPASRVAAWLDAHMVELSDHSAIAVHLDTLGALPAVGDLLAASLGALAALAVRLTEVGDPGRAGLVLPLRSAAPGLVAVAPPTLAALAAQLHPMEPPSLCVIPRRGLAPDAPVERGAPLPFDVSPPDGALPAGCALHAYYREHALERAVHVDVLPPTHA